MSEFEIIAIATETADRVRRTMKAPGYGHPAFAEVATGHGPCRHCLCPFQIGVERRILFTYDPFRDVGEEPLPGPVFIHAEPCDRYVAGRGYPDLLRSHAVRLQAFGKHRQLLAEERVEGGNVEQTIRSLLGRDGILYLHVRDGEAGCYDFRIQKH